MDKSKIEVRILDYLIGYCSQEQFDIESVQYLDFVPLKSVDLKSGHLSYIPFTGEIDIYNEDGECIQSSDLKMTNFLTKQRN